MKNKHQSNRPSPPTMEVLAARDAASRYRPGSDLDAIVATVCAKLEEDGLRTDVDKVLAAAKTELGLQ